MRQKNQSVLGNQLRTALKTCTIKLAHLKILDFYELTSLQIYITDHLFVMTIFEMFLL